MVANQEAQRGFLRPLAKDLKIQFAQGERRRWEIDLARGMAREQWRQGVVANAIKLGEEFVQMRQVIDADEPWEVKDGELYSRKFSCSFKELVIDRVRKHTPQNYDPQDAATNRLAHDVIVNRPNRQVCSICVCPPNNSIRFLNLLTRDGSNPDEVPSRSIRLAQDNPQGITEKILKVLAERNKGRRLVEEIREEDGQKVEVKILVCDGEENFISAQEVRKAEEEVITQETKTPRLEIPKFERVLPLPELTRQMPVLMFQNIYTNPTELSTQGQGRSIFENKQSSVPVEIKPPQPEPVSIVEKEKLESKRTSPPPPILTFRNNRTKVETQSGLVFEAGKKKQKVAQKVPTQEIPIEADSFQLELLSMFQIIEKSSEKQITAELPTNTRETQMVVLKPAQSSTMGENHAVSPVVKMEQPQVKKENEQSLSLNEVIPLEPVVEVEQELVGIIVDEEMVKKEVVEEATTIPLIEIPAPQSIENNLQPQTQVIEVEIEPVDKNQTGINEMLTEITQPASQEIENEEIQEDVGPIEQKEPKIFAVEEFKVKPLSYINISIYENSRQKPEVERLEIKKLIWVVSSSKNQNQPAILELEFSKDPDPNKAALRFLHFLRKVARKVVAQKFGNDILRTRKIKMIRADEPVEVIRKIEYYLEVLRGTYAQVFAFVS